MFLSLTLSKSIGIGRLLCRGLGTALLLTAASGCHQKSESAMFAFASTAGQHFFFSRPDAEADTEEKNAAHLAVLSALRTAEHRVEVWCYGLDDEDLLNQLASAKDSGKSVTIVGSPDENYAEAEKRGLSVQRRLHAGIQHAKVILIDRRTMVAGTGNFTKSDFFHNHNVYIVLPVPEASGGLIASSLAHEESPSPVRLPFQGGMLFSPGQGRVIQSVLAQTILEAREIRFMIFSHTDPVITAALAWKVQRGGLVEGIYDDASESGSLPGDTEAARLNQVLGSNAAALYLDGNRARFEAQPGAYHGGHLHHKTMIADGCVYTGSYNWSIGARDNNEEVFFRFCDAGVVELFRSEFDRVRARALRLARPPRPAAPGVLYMNEDQVCRSNAAQAEAVLFSGRHASFRAEVIQFALGESCRDLSERESASAGILAGSDYTLPLHTEHGRPANSTLDLAAVAGTDATDDLCPGTCQSAPLYRIHMSDGWVWLRTATRYVRARFWTSKGLVPLDLELDAEGFYRFPPNIVRGDSLIFLETASGEMEAACVRTGVSMGKSLETWIRFHEWETGKTLSCVEDER